VSGRVSTFAPGNQSGTRAVIERALRHRVEAELDRRITSVTRVSGGDINDAFELALDDGQSVFLKSNAHAPLAMFAAEAQGLSFLEQARALRVPKVLGVSTSSERPSFLLLEFIRSAPARRGFDEELGRGLAALHRAGAASFGFAQPNFIGRLPQSNREHSSWAEFYQAERLEPQLSAAIAGGHAPSALQRDFERLFRRLPELVGDGEAPARLHGDLWSGNVHSDEHGAPCLIDPAVYGGHREVDLAMMQLFGGFGARVFSAYTEAFPLTAGHRDRVSLYQLYPLLVHVNLFGSGYLASVQRALSAYC
jgi:fructosamine-3-kinase